MEQSNRSGQEHPHPSSDISLFGYEIHIAPEAGAVGALRFTDPQLLTEQAAGTYLLAGDTDPGIFSGFVDNAPANDILFGGDGTLSGGNVTLAAADGTRLLARLDLEHVLPGMTPPAVAAGSQYTLSLQDTFDTFFEDDLFNPQTIVASSFGAAGNGIITVNAAAVPEPSTFAIIALAFAGFGIHRRRKAEKRMAVAE